jgi:pre-mRNA-splicing factor ATP-dependent RNA helicase DHX16
VVLLLKSLHINNLLQFDFMDPPPQETLIKSLEQLYALGALNDKGELTKLGFRMAELPTDPQLSKMLLQAEHFSCVQDCLTICAMLDAGDEIFIRPGNSAPPEKKIQADVARASFARGIGRDGDHLVLLNVYNLWKDAGYSRHWCKENFIQERAMNRARDVRDQLDSLCDRVEIKKEPATESGHQPDSVAIRKAITAGYFYNLCRLTSSPSAEIATYLTVKTKISVYVHPSSSMYQADPPPKFLIYHNLMKTTKEYMREVIAIETSWLTEIAPHYYRKGVDFDANDGDPHVKKSAIVKAAFET